MLSSNVCVLQALSHEAAAQHAHLIFICVQREHYDFMEPLAPQLKGKVPMSNKVFLYFPTLQPLLTLLFLSFG